MQARERGVRQRGAHQDRQAPLQVLNSTQPVLPWAKGVEQADEEEISDLVAAERYEERNG